MRKKKLRTNPFAFHFTDSFTGCDGSGDTCQCLNGCCSNSNPCGVSEGDCDNDDDCQGHLLCGTDNCLYPFPSSADCCYEPFLSEQRITSKFAKGQYLIFFYFSNLIDNKEKTIQRPYC